MTMVKCVHVLIALIALIAIAVAQKDCDLKPHKHFKLICDCGEKFLKEDGVRALMTMIAAVIELIFVFVKDD
jgi:hypothetical protein